MSELAKKLIAKEKKERTGKLKLSDCGINNLLHVQELFNLTWLKELDLSNYSNVIHSKEVVAKEGVPVRNSFKYLIPKFEKLKNLEVLKISGANSGSSVFGLEDVAGIEGLNNLIKLDLSGNRLKNITALKTLNKLSVLKLFANQIEDIVGLSYLKNLKSLDLRRNSINSIVPLGDSVNFEILKLGGNLIEDISMLEKNTNLIHFSCWENRISSFDVIRNFKTIKELEFGGNDFNDLQFLTRLSSLKRLQLIDGNVEELYPIKDINSLEYLDFSENVIIDLTPIRNLSNLKELLFRGNGVSSIKHLENLRNLKVLDCSGNQISDLTPLSYLYSLEYLNFSKNHVGNIEDLADLEELETLFFSGNEIKDLTPIEYFENLKKLDIQNNRIENLLPLKNFFAKNPWLLDGVGEYWGTLGEGIKVKGNPLVHPPYSIVEEGNEAILNYFRQLEEEGKEEYLFETKLLIIGEAGSGKTTFSRRLQRADANMPDDSTHGIEIDTWTFDISENTFEKLNHKEAKFHANLWDFGGQEIYHGTHQFFFSEKSLYVLLCDTREQKTDFRYWLNTVEQLCGEEAHLFVLFNRREDHDWQMDAGFKERFKSIIKDEYMIDLSVVESIPELQKKIKEHLHALPEVGQKLIQSWVEIRNDLAEEKANHISFDRFREICAAHGRTREDDIKNISRYFDRIGVFTHYIDDVVLRERVYLNSNHLVKTIYQLLDNGDIKKHKGRIGKKNIEAVWEKLGFEKERLPRLLEKFGLMYEVPNQSEYIIPEHLPDGAPYVFWKYENKKPRLHFRYEFDKYMPKGLMSRLIVALHKYIDNHNMVWRRGVNISFRNAQAEITESLGGTNRFDIRIMGDFRRDLLVVITEAFDDILSDFKKLSVSREVQCPCEECVKNEEPYFHKMERIENAILKANKSGLEVKCDVSYETIRVPDLLGLVNFEWVFNKVEQRSRNENIHMTEIHGLRQVMEEVKRTVLETNLLVKKIPAEFSKIYRDISDEIENYSASLFNENSDEERRFFEKVEKLIAKYNVKDVPEDWHDQMPKEKLKFVLKVPFLEMAELKYEGEIDFTNFKAPKNWSDVKRWFLKKE